jgi:hypothetical protein
VSENFRRNFVSLVPKALGIVSPDPSGFINAKKKERVNDIETSTELIT